jgi:signal transduction histidine kinase
MARVFRNLVDNALKHGGEGLTKIQIGYNEDPRFHIISFTNDGKALSRKDAALIFEMFGRLPEAKKVEGTGLGLAIVKELVERHDGKVWFESHGRKGTTFCIAIPKGQEKQAGTVDRNAKGPEQKSRPQQVRGVSWRPISRYHPTGVTASCNLN